MAFNPGVLAGAITAATTHAARISRINNDNVRIENKTIVYSDTVLPLKELGNNLKVSTVSGVGEYSLERCLQTIFESNPNVVFNTIQYSKNNKKVYFYTNQEISTKEYEDSKVTNYKPLTTSTEILEETKKILLAEKNKDNDVVSLFDVSLLLKRKDRKYKHEKDKFEDVLDEIVKSKFCDDSAIINYGIDYETKELKIGFKRWRSGDYEKIYFSEKNDELYIAKSESHYAKELFSVTSHILTKLYSDLMQYADYQDTNKGKYAIHAVNSDFLVNVWKYGVEIYVKTPNTHFSNDFELNSPAYDNRYDLECNSSIVLDAIRNQEQEIFKRLYVKIDDCPEWCQDELYVIRQNQLINERKQEEERLLEEQRIADEKKYQEMKKQKRLELVRKVFPFIKK